MEKYLIINADDFGMCHAQNAATAELLARGSVTSATVMAPCAVAAEAVAFAAAHPEHAIGVHLTTTSEHGNYRWSPLCGARVTSLRDEQGYMHRSSAAFAAHADVKDVETELEAQIARLLEMGLSPSHLDNHMGTLYGVETGRFELLNVAFSLAEKYRLPFRFPAVFTERQRTNAMLDIKIPKEQIERVLGYVKQMLKDKQVVTPDYLMPGDWNGPQADSFENYKEYVFELYRTLDHGVTETYIHPAVECDELKSITPFWQRRCYEYQLFRDPCLLQHIHALGIKLISYRDLAAMKG
ncbi:MAG: ChbG/HpnK family deacetylase [Ruminococcaceae bacterium]|nr:ChbG/HpnK family deacetylase [Oscillospiraceae bacterium]